MYIFGSYWMTPPVEIFIVLPKGRGWRRTSTIGQYGPSKRVPPVFIPYMSIPSFRLRSSTMVGSTGFFVLCCVTNMVKSDRCGKSCNVRFPYDTVLIGCFYRKHLRRTGMEKWNIGEFYSINNAILVSNHHPTPV
jgi:hypothetical protein